MFLISWLKTKNIFCFSCFNLFLLILKALSYVLNFLAFKVLYSYMACSYKNNVYDTHIHTHTHTHTHAIDWLIG